MLLAQGRRVLMSSVMVVNCTLICAIGSLGQSCEEIQTVFIFVRYGKIQHMSKKYFLGRVLYFPISHTIEHRLDIVLPGLEKETREQQ